jgi:hypothetical protein
MELKKYIANKKEYWNTETKSKRWMPLCLQVSTIFLSIGSVTLFTWIVSGVYASNVFSWIVIGGTIFISIMILVGIIMYGIYSVYEMKLNPRNK